MSKNISFRVATLEPSCPDFLFTIKNFTNLTLEKASVMSTVKEIWNDDTTQQFFQSIIDETPPAEQESRKHAISNFVNSMWIKCLDIRTSGNCLDPEFNVYAKGALFQDTKLWPKVRRFLANRTYANDELGQGSTTTSAHLCVICHGRDHPRGLCPFPLIDGWLGPKRIPVSKQQRQGGRPRRGFPHAT